MAGQTVSAYGSHVSALGYPLLVLALTHSAVSAGLVATVGAVAGYCGGIAGGVVVDRVDRRQVIIASATVRGCAVALTAVAVMAGFAHLGVIIVSVALGGFFGMPAFVAQDAALVRIVDSDQLEAAVAQDQARQQAASLAGTGTGGLLFGLARSVPFVVDAVSYLATIVSTVYLRTSLAVERESASKERFGAELTAGVRWLRAHPTLALFFGCQALVNFTAGGVELVIVVLSRRAGATPFEVGIALAAGSVGGVIGALASARMLAAVGRFRAVMLSLWGITTLTAALSVVPGSVGLGAALALMLFLMPASGVVIMGMLLRAVPDELRGRVMSVIVPLNAGLGAAGPLAGGALLSAFGSAGALVLAVPGAVGAGLISTLPSIRTLLSEPPD